MESLCGYGRVTLVCMCGSSWGVQEGKTYVVNDGDIIHFQVRLTRSERGGDLWLFCGTLTCVPCYVSARFTESRGKLSCDHFSVFVCGLVCAVQRDCRQEEVDAVGQGKIEDRGETADRGRRTGEEGKWKGGARDSRKRRLQRAAVQSTGSWVWKGGGGVEYAFGRQDSMVGRGRSRAESTDPRWGVGLACLSRQR